MQDMLNLGEGLLTPLNTPHCHRRLPTELISLIGTLRAARIWEDLVQALPELTSIRPRQLKGCDDYKTHFHLTWTRCQSTSVFLFLVSVHVGSLSLVEPGRPT